MILYTVPGCFKCGRVKNKLKDLEIKFEEVICDASKIAELIKKSNSLSMPILFDGDKEIDIKEILNHD